MKKLLIALGMLCAPATANAAPVYLECLLSGGGDSAPLKWEITINEAEGRVDYSHPQHSDSVRAVFTANEVKFSSLVIDRTNLTITRSITIGSSPPIVSKGQCKLVERKNKAF